MLAPTYCGASSSPSNHMRHYSRSAVATPLNKTRNSRVYTGAVHGKFLGDASFLFNNGSAVRVQEKRVSRIVTLNPRSRRLATSTVGNTHKKVSYFLSGQDTVRPKMPISDITVTERKIANFVARHYHSVLLPTMV